MNARTVFRNPYVWGFLIGIVTLTALRPRLRYIPEPPPVLSQVPDFSLVGMDGKPFGSAELRGTVYVANLFSTSCKDDCPAVMKGMARLQSGFAQRDIRGVRLVSISLDPEHDTSAVLAAYATGAGVDPGRWTLLTGDPRKVRELVAEGFEAASHTGKLVLVDGLGRIRGTYGSDEQGLDEVYNRAQHVLRQERETNRSR